MVTPCHGDDRRAIYRTPDVESAPKKIRMGFRMARASAYAFESGKAPRDAAATSTLACFCMACGNCKGRLIPVSNTSNAIYQQFLVVRFLVVLSKRCPSNKDKANLLTRSHCWIFNRTDSIS